MNGQPFKCLTCRQVFQMTFGEPVPHACGAALPPVNWPARAEAAEKKLDIAKRVAEAHARYMDELSGWFWRWRHPAALRRLHDELAALYMELYSRQFDAEELGNATGETQA